MNCKETLPMLSGYMDGELDLVYRLEIERHLQICPECARHIRNCRALQSVVQSDRLYYLAPRGLECKVLAAVRKAEKAERPNSRRWLRPAFGIAAFASLLAVCWLVFAQVRGEEREATLTRHLTCSHVQSLMANHLLDVASADPQVVKLWFNGRLDYAPSVVDLSRLGYPLSGGRLDYANDRSVAALVYNHQQHVINLFLWPSTDSDTQAVREESHNGYRVVQWTAGAMTYCAVSDLSAEELSVFAELFQRHNSPVIQIQPCR